MTVFNSPSLCFLVLVLPSSVVYVILFKELFFLFETWRKGNAFFLFPPNFSGSFFLFFRKPSGFAWASQPHRPYPEPFPLPLWPPSLSIAGAKVDTFYLPAKCFDDFFWSIFYHRWMSGGYKGRKKRGIYRASPLNPVSAPFILSVRARQGSPETQKLFWISSENSYAAFSKFVSGLFPHSYSSHSPLCSS